MQLKDTVEMMCSADYVERFKAEYHQLAIRRESLGNMLNGYRKNTLNFQPKCSYELLQTQYMEMGDYMTTLEKRAEIEGIDLSFCIEEPKPMKAG